MGLEGTLIGRVGRQLEGLDPNVVAGRDVDWKGWIRTLIGRGLDPDVDRKDWKGLDLDVVDGGLDGVGRDVDWKDRTSIGRVGPGRCCWKGR